MNKHIPNTRFKDYQSSLHPTLEKESYPHLR